MNSKILTAIALLLALASAGQAAEPTKIPIRFTTPGKGQFSLGVCDDSGMLIRSLTYAGEVGGGKQTLEWDELSLTRPPIPQKLPIRPRNGPCHQSPATEPVYSCPFRSSPFSSAM